MVSRFTHVLACITISFPFKAEYPMTWTDCILLDHPLADGHRRNFHFGLSWQWITLLWCSCTSCKWMCVLASLGDTLGTAGSACNFPRNRQLCSPPATLLRSHQHCIRFQFLRVFTNTRYVLACSSFSYHPKECDMPASNCGFGSHFPED